MKESTLLRISIFSLLLIAGLANAYSLAVTASDNPQIKDPVTVTLNLTANSTNNETGAHECLISIYATDSPDESIRVYRYNAIVPELSNLKTNEAGYSMFQFRTNDFEYIVHKEYTAWATCAGATASDTFVLTPKDEGLWLLNTALGLNQNIDNIIGAVFVLFGLGFLLLFIFVVSPIK